MTHLAQTWDEEILIELRILEDRVPQAEVDVIAAEEQHADLRAAVDAIRRHLGPAELPVTLLRRIEGMQNIAAIAWTELQGKRHALDRLRTEIKHYSEALDRLRSAQERADAAQAPVTEAA